MDTPQIAIAQRTLDGAENGQMNFGQIVTTLSEAGFDGYWSTIAGTPQPTTCSMATISVSIWISPRQKWPRASSPTP